MTFNYPRLASFPLKHLSGAQTAGIIVAAAGAAAAMAFVSVNKDEPPGTAGSIAGRQMLPIEAPPLLLRDLPPQDALSLNRAMPFAKGPNPAARPFDANGDDVTYQRALECLATAIYYEAGNEPEDGQRAVAQVVLNRVRHPAFVPSVCGVVYHGSLRVTGCQFSFTCDGSMNRQPNEAIWARVRAVAAQALAGAVFKPVGYATHYHADYVVPYWATSLAKNAVIGRHIFYRWPEWWGTPGAFARRHANAEADPRLLRDRALRRPQVRQASQPAPELVIETDPKVELLGVIKFLAAATPLTSESSAYEKSVLTHFESFSEHVAIQILRQLSDAPRGMSSETLLTVVDRALAPAGAGRNAAQDAELEKALGGRDKLDGLVEAIREFVTHSDFKTFYEEQRPYLVQLAETARPPAVAMFAGLRRDTGLPLESPKLILTPLQSTPAVGTCQTLSGGNPEMSLIVGVQDGTAATFAKPKQFRNALAKLSASVCSKPLPS